MTAEWARRTDPGIKSARIRGRTARGSQVLVTRSADQTMERALNPPGSSLRFHNGTPAVERHL